jgi:hypothetical protein
MRNDRTYRSALRFDSIDDCLGPGATRFFASGYRRVRYCGADAVTGECGGRLRGEVAAVYPADWSKKAGEGLRPHLSTIDALILGTGIADVHVTGRRWLRRVDVKAGPTPYEKDLERIPVEASRRPTTPVLAARGRPVSIFDCRVGNMDVRCEVEHGTGPAPSERPLYGQDYRTQRQAIESLRVDLASLQADAVVTLDSASVSMVDSFVVSLQLGQVLLYELDRLERAASNTLWMRQTTIRSDAPQVAASGAFTATASLAHSKMLPARGGTWRTATILGDCNGVRTRCAVAHQLPVGTEGA